MNMDDDLERLLTRYRPVGPPPELRDRVMRAAASRKLSRSAWDLASAAAWLPVAAALLLAVSLYALAANARHAAALTPAFDAREHRARFIELITNYGDDDVRAAIEYLTDLEEQWTAADAARRQTPDIEQVERD